MTIASPTRTSRRTAGRRKVIVDESDASDIENTITTRDQDDDAEEEEEYTPAPKSTRASPRRKTVVNAGRRATTARRARATESVEPSIEPSQMFSPPESVADESLSPTKRSPPKRRSVKDARAARKSRVSRLSIAPDSDSPPAHPQLPTPKTTVSPEPMSRQGTPLMDITESAINEQTPKPSSRSLTPPEDDATSTADATTPKLARRQSLSPPDEEVVEVTEVAQTPRMITKVDPNITKLDRPMDIVVRKRALGVPQTQEPVEPKARMTITYLILTNFKSYAGRQEVGPFHASFSSVVGPNGSGKSNVIDSLLFVFGFRASKMRQGKISALIHNSAQHPDLDFCEVEVHFQEVMDQPAGGLNVVPDSQLVISRRAFKNDSSKYYINGKTSNFTTVTTLLKDRGIDLDHKRFLILQGEVESIAQMKPKAADKSDDGLLEYLEDIIGTSKYKQPIDEAALETEALNEVCLEKNSRVQHVEKEKNGLESKKEKALAYIRNENELASKQSALYQIYVAECGDNIHVTEEAIEQIQVQLDSELGRHKEAEDEIHALESEYKSGTKQHSKLDKETAVLAKKVEDLDKAGIKVEEKRKHLNSKANKLRKTIDSSRYGVDESNTLAKQAYQDIARISGEVEELERQMLHEDEELATIRENLKGKTQDLSDQIATKQKDLEPWIAKMSEKQSAIAVAQSELDILRDQENAGATATAEVEAKIAALQEQRESKHSESQDCAREQKSAEEQISKAQAQLTKISTKEFAMKANLSNARQKADEARASLSAAQSQGNVLSALARLKESGRIDGFNGRLGNLGAIDAKYDVAISTAAPALDNIVVDTVECAQQCIEYLRKNGLGRASFICLEKLAQRDLSPIQTPENCPRLFDLVKSKHERFLPAFYHVLQNTLVTKDSDQADRVAYGAKRWRVVSLEGKLIDKSGVMSGGGNRVAKGAMSSKIASLTTKEQVAKYEVDRDALESEYTQLQQQMQDFENEIRKLQSQVPKLETQAQRWNLELGSIDRNIDDAQKRMQELASGQQTAKSNKSKQASLEKSIASVQVEMQKLQSEVEVIEASIKGLQDKIMEIGGVKLRSQKAKVDGLKEQIASLNESRDGAEVAKSKAEKQIIKHEKTHRDATAELEKIEADLEIVEGDVKSQCDNTSGLRKQLEQGKMELEDKRDELQELKRQLDAHIAELNNTRGAEVDMRNKLEENNKHLVDNQKRLHHWQEKLGKVTLQNVSEEGEEKEPELVPELSRDELEDLDKDELKAAIATLEERTSQHVELSVLAEYRRRVNEYTSRLDDLNTALAARDTAKKRTDDLRRLRLEGFMEGFSTISLRLKEMYQMITMGGNAELELVDSLDPFSEGILFSVMPPKKSWKNISNLSGGEKTLSSLALVFALHHYKPTPLYVMDEIDAALDFRNVSIVAAYIKERTKNAQFIVISLRNNMFELAERLVGVYKVNHMTKSVTVENRDYIVPHVQQR